MVPVTRSAARSESQKDKPEKTKPKPNSKRPSKARAAKQSQPESPSPSPPMATQAAQPPLPGPILEWISIKKPNNAEGSSAEHGKEKAEVTALLREVLRQFRRTGCKAIITGHSHPIAIADFVVIEWCDGNDRQQFLESEESKDFTTWMQAQSKRGRTVTTDLIRKMARSPWQVMNHINATDPPRHIETWTAYFPTTLSREDHSCLERIQGLYFWIPDSGGGSLDNRPEAMKGLLSQSHGWMEGEVEFQGQSVRRLVYFFTWESQAAEERYKQELRSDGSEVLLQGLDFERSRWEGPWQERTTMEVFVDNLRVCGMRGYETQYARFQKVYEN